MSIVLRWHLNFDTTVAVNFSNSTCCIFTLPCTLSCTDRKFKESIFKILFYISQASVGDRQYKIILFISIIFLPTILNYILMTERGGTIIFCRILMPPPPSIDATILNYLNDREGAPLSFVGFWRPLPRRHNT